MLIVALAHLSNFHTLLNECHVHTHPSGGQNVAFVVPSVAASIARVAVVSGVEVVARVVGVVGVDDVARVVVVFVVDDIAVAVVDVGVDVVGRRVVVVAVDNGAREVTVVGVDVVARVVVVAGVDDITLVAAVTDVDVLAAVVAAGVTAAFPSGCLHPINSTLPAQYPCHSRGCSRSLSVLKAGSTIFSWRMSHAWLPLNSVGCIVQLSLVQLPPSPTYSNLYLVMNWPWPNGRPSVCTLQIVTGSANSHSNHGFASPSAEAHPFASIREL
jgi:hypothetical protein